MLLAIDIGNTQIALGVYDQKKLMAHWRICADRLKTSDEYGILIKDLFHYASLDPKKIGAIVISCVVPPLLGVFEEVSSKYFGVKPLVVDYTIDIGIPLRYDNPREIGADRIANAVAAYELYGGGVIVVDFGTATTFDVITKEGEYIGGVIAPGVGISADALFHRAAKLPKVELLSPKRVIGSNTIVGMQAGIIYGFAGQVDEIVRRIKKEIGTKAFVVATGGFAELISPESATIQKVDPFLTLEGLRLIYERTSLKVSLSGK